MLARDEWIDAFTQELRRLLAAASLACPVRETHGGILCGTYDVRVAVADPRHETRITIVATNDHHAHPEWPAVPGTEFHAHLGVKPLTTASKIARWLQARLAERAA